MEGYLLTVDIYTTTFDHYFLIAVLDKHGFKRKFLRWTEILLNCHLYMNSGNSDYFFVDINYNPPREYQFVNHVDYATRRYKSVALDK